MSSSYPSTQKYINFFFEKQEQNLYHKILVPSRSDLTFWTQHEIFSAITLLCWWNLKRIFYHQVAGNSANSYASNRNFLIWMMFWKSKEWKVKSVSDFILRSICHQVGILIGNNMNRNLTKNVFLRSVLSWKLSLSAYHSYDEDSVLSKSS